MYMSSGGYPRIFSKPNNEVSGLLLSLSGRVTTEYWYSHNNLPNICVSASRSLLRNLLQCSSYVIAPGSYFADRFTHLIESLRVTSRMPSTDERRYPLLNLFTPQTIE